MKIKRILLSAIGLLTMALMFVGCGNDSAAKEKSAAVRPAAQSSVETKNTVQEGANGLKGKKILIAYFSHTNHTWEFAEEIQKNIGGNLFAIEPLKSYPTSHDAVVAQAKTEVNSGYTPQLKQDIARYNGMASMYGQQAQLVEFRDFDGYRDASALQERCLAVVKELNEHLAILEKQKAALENCSTAPVKK